MNRLSATIPAPKLMVRPVRQRRLQIHDPHFARDGQCNGGDVGRQHDIAGTAFGLLPLLDAGHTHKEAAKPLYAKHVECGP